MTNDDDSTQTPQQTPGQLLRGAREALGWAQADIAGKLHLSVQTIKDIESDDYSHINALIYVRGYLRSYARETNQSAETILEAFNALGIAEPNTYERLLRTENVLPISTGPRRMRKLDRKWLRWVTLGLMVFLIALVVMWWQGQKHHLHSQANAAELNSNVVAIAPANSLALPKQSDDTQVVPTATTAAKPVVDVNKHGSQQTAVQILQQQVQTKTEQNKTVSLTPPGKLLPNYQVISVK